MNSNKKNPSKTNWVSWVMWGIPLFVMILTLVGMFVVEEVREYFGLSSNSSESQSGSTSHQEPELPIESALPITPEHEMGVFIIDENNKINWNLSNQIVSILKSKEHDVITSALFDETAPVGTVFNNLFNGDASEIKRLNLVKRFKQLVLGKKSVQFTENPELENTITAQVSLQIHLITLSTGTIENSLTITVPGIGFSQVQSETNAIEEIVNQLANKL